MNNKIFLTQKVTDSKGNMFNVSFSADEHILMDIYISFDYPVANELYDDESFLNNLNATLKEDGYQGEDFSYYGAGGEKYLVFNGENRLHSLKQYLSTKGFADVEYLNEVLREQIESQVEGLDVYSFEKVYRKFKERMRNYVTGSDEAKYYPTAKKYLQSNLLVDELIQDTSIFRQDEKNLFENDLNYLRKIELSDALIGEIKQFEYPESFVYSLLDYIRVIE